MLVAQLRQLHGLFEDALLALAVGHVPGKLVLDLFESLVISALVHLKWL